VLAELGPERTKLFEKDGAKLEKQAQPQAAVIEKLAGETPVRIG
jgi:hypothetical protein